MQRDVPLFNSTNPIIVKHIEHESGKFGGIAIGEELAVDVLELVQLQLSAGTVPNKVLQWENGLHFAESLPTCLVPLPQLFPCEIRFLLQLHQFLGRQLFIRLFPLLLGRLLPPLLMTRWAAHGSVPVRQILSCPTASTELAVAFAHLIGLASMK